MGWVGIEEHDGMMGMHTLGWAWLRRLLRADAALSGSTEEYLYMNV